MPELLRDLVAMASADQVLAVALGVVAAAWVLAMCWLVLHAYRNADGAKSREKGNR